MCDGKRCNQHHIVTNNSTSIGSFSQIHIHRYVTLLLNIYIYIFINNLY